MNIYDVSHVNGDIYEVEAEFYQREDDDWVFYAGGSATFRIGSLDVLSVSKSNLRPPPAAEHVGDQLFL